MNDQSVPSSTSAPALVLAALGVAAFIIILAILQEMGMPPAALSTAALLLPLAAVVVAALAAPAGGSGGIHKGARGLGGAVGGLAAGAVVAAAPSFSGLGARAFEAGYDGLWPGAGIALGFVIAGAVLTPRLARHNAATIAEVIDAEYGIVARILTALIVLTLSLLCLAVGLSGLIAIASAVAAVTREQALIAASVVVLAVVIPGAMRSATWAQAVAGIVVAGGVIAIAVVLAWKRLQNPFAIFAYGDALTEVGRLEIALIGQKLADGATLKRHAVPYISTDAVNYIGAVLSTALGLAAFPLLAQRALAAPSAASARGVMAGGLLALLPVIVLIPAIAVFMKLDLYTQIAKMTHISSLPDWARELGERGLLKVCGVSPSVPEGVTAACGALSGHKGVLRLQDLRLNADLGLIAAPRIGGTPAFLSAFAGAGLAAGLVAFCAGAALAGADALARGFGRPSEGADAVKNAILWRVAAALLVATAAVAVGALPNDVVSIADWILPLSAATLFVPLLLGLTWPRATAAGVIAAMIAGTAFVSYYLLATRYWPVAFVETWASLSHAAPSALRKLDALKMAWDAASDADKPAAYMALQAHARGVASWGGIKAPAAGLIGVVPALVAGILVSLLTRARSGSRSDAAAADKKEAAAAGQHGS